MASGVNLQPREIASATVVPPHEQDTCRPAGWRAEIDQFARKIKPQAAHKSGMDLESNAKNRLRGRRLV